MQKLSQLTLTNTKAITTAKPGDALAYVVGRTPSSILTLSDPSLQLVLTNEVVRVRSPLRPGPINFTIIETIGTVAANTNALTLIAVPPLTGTVFDTRRIGRKIFQEMFTGYLDLYHPTKNPNARWKSFYNFGNGFNDVGSRTLSYGNGASGNAEGEVYSDADFNGVNPFSGVPGGGELITARAMPIAIQSKMWNMPVTSGMLRTSNPLFTSGYFEFRGRWDSKQGMWPAYWLYNAHGTGPEEIDTLEVVSDKNASVGSGNPGFATVCQNIHARTGENGLSLGTKIDPDSSDAMHTYSTAWDANNVIQMIDGVVTGSIPTPPNMRGQQMDIIIDLAVGWFDDSWPGHFVPSLLPYKMWTDFVRVYTISPPN